MPVLHTTKQLCDWPAWLQSEPSTVSKAPKSRIGLARPAHSDPPHPQQEPELQPQFKQRVLPAALQQREV